VIDEHDLKVEPGDAMHAENASFAVSDEKNRQPIQRLKPRQASGNKGPINRTHQQQNLTCESMAENQLPIFQMQRSI